MTWAILDDFADKYGRWNQWSPWDTTWEFQSSKGFLTTQSHVNIRNFRPGDFKQLSMSDLDALSMSTLDATTMSAMETAPTANTENWVLSGSGLNAISVGFLAGRSGWSGLSTTTTGAAVSALLTSSLATQIDISTMSKLSFIMPDYNSFDTATSYIQLTSEPSGSFANAAYLSPQVLFSANTGALPQLLWNLSSFTTGAGASFSAAKVTGVRIQLTNSVAPTAGQTVSIMALRALGSSWTESNLDFDTISGRLVVPVTLTGNAYAGSVAKIPLIRGDQSKLDPIPADGALMVYFNCGGNVNRSTGTNYNYMDLIFREIHDSVGNTGSWITARLQYNGSGTLFQLFRTDWNGTTETLVGTINDSSINALDPTQIYLFQVTYQGTTINATLYQTDGKRNPTNLVWRFVGSTSSNWVYRNGRVGFNAQFVDRDAWVDYFDAAPRGYARFRSEVWNSRTPVDGAQLAAVFAEDRNLFQTFTASDLFIDQTKTLSGNGSYRSGGAMTSNGFLVEDWANTYFQCSIWTPAGVTTKNQPQIFLVTPSGTQSIPTPKMQAAQWNSIYFDLGIFRNLLTGTQYQIQIKPGTTPDSALGNYWVDNVLVGRRRVAWRFRAQANGTFRPFKGMVNQPKMALHLPPEERGTALQIECEALTNDAWTGSFKLFPHYAELGNPVYDAGFETRV